MKNIGQQVVMAVSLIIFAGAAQADSGKMKFSFDSAEVTDIVKTFQKATGERFVLDGSVRGKASILVSDEVTRDEAYALMSSALAANSYAISIQGDTKVVTSARNVQRSLIPVETELPTLKPERMASWVAHLQNITANDVNQTIVRQLPSRDGEYTVINSKNLMFTDWASNLHRINDALSKIDIPLIAKDMDRRTPPAGKSAKKSKAESPSAAQ